VLQFIPEFIRTWEAEKLFAAVFRYDSCLTGFPVIRDFDHGMIQINGQTVFEKYTGGYIQTGYASVFQQCSYTALVLRLIFRERSSA
jgi:hypothetical protein